MKFLLSAFFGLTLMSLVACQSPGRRPSSEISQVRVLPKGTTFTLSKNLTFKAGSDNIDFHGDVSAGATSATFCNIKVLRFAEPGSRIQLKSGVKYMITRSHVKAQYNDVGANEDENLLTPTLTGTEYVIQRDGRSDYAESILTCRSCQMAALAAAIPAGRAPFATSSCTSNVTPENILYVLKANNFTTYIGGGPSVVDLPLRTTIEPIRYEVPEKSSNGTVEI